LTTALHPLLLRQLRRCQLRPDELPTSAAAWAQLLDRISRTYRDADDERYLVERSLDVSSAELQALYRDLQASAAAVERERSQLRCIVADAPIAMAMFDTEMRYVTHSRKWLEDYNLHGREIIGCSHYQVLPDQPDEWRDAYRACLAGAVMVQAEDALLLADGSRIHLRWAIHPWHTPAGGIGGIVMVTDRIDDLVKAREAALATARLKSEFLATMSHEIRTPMNGVLGLTALLLETALDAQQREYAQGIHLSAENLLTIVNDILDFSKIDAGRLELEEVDLDPRALVQEVLELLAESAHRQGLELASQVGGDVPQTVRGDPVRLRQILLNLVGNAIKFTPSGEVVVSVRRDRAPRGHEDGALSLSFAVRDTGIGLTPEARARLFQPFSQGDGSTTRRYGGTGLGLAICRKLVGLMGGDISASNRPGGGSCFRFSVSLAAARAAGSAPPREDRGMLRGSRVLVVDGNTSQRRILGADLRRHGLVATLAASAASGLARAGAATAAGTPFDLAIVDLRQVDGDPVALRAALEARNGGNLPIVLLGSVLERSQLDAARTAGFAACLTKPISAAKLFDCLHRVWAEVSQDPPVGPSPAMEQRPERTVARGRLLLVEDNPINQKVAAALLRRAGYHVTVCGNGKSALEMLAETEFDLVLMDCQMPEMDGFATTRELRRRERATSRHVVVIALTAGAMAGDRETCLQAGMDDYLSKPFRAADLLRVVETWMPATSRR
jgi:PAS domain S-box-containing protein